MSRMPHLGTACHGGFAQYQLLKSTVEYSVRRMRGRARIRHLASLGANACKGWDALARWTHREVSL